MTLLRSWLGPAALVACCLHVNPASAAPPGDWSVAVERLFGIVRTTIDDDDGISYSGTSVSLMSKVGGSTPYSSPRLAIDYLTGSSFTFGGALGYQSNDGEGSGDSWLVAPRVGYFVRPSSSFGLWPRIGLTQVLFEDLDQDATALTLELPLEFLVGGGVAIAVMPHADIGIGGSANNEDRTITELGLQFGLGAFF